MTKFDPNCEGLIITLKCPCCGDNIECEINDLPYYYQIAKDYYFQCNCGTNIVIDVFSNRVEGNVIAWNECGENYNQVEIIKIEELY